MNPCFMTNSAAKNLLDLNPTQRPNLPLYLR